MNLTPKFDQALHYAVLIHAGQLRKETEIPYLAHLLGVASIALEYGANEEEAIGALLHDAGEDAGGDQVATDDGEDHVEEPVLPDLGDDGRPQLDER